MSKNPNVNPAHYKAGGMEVIDILRAKLTPYEFAGYLKGNVIKYTLRANLKGGKEDLEKAAWYASMMSGTDPREVVTAPLRPVAPAVLKKARR